jgi:hypothetical protein
MIDEVYRDAGTTMKDGVETPFVNDAHEWWVRFVDGKSRPATETEVELWQLAMGYKDNFEGACKNYWDTYCAGTGKTMETFAGVDGKTPEDEVRNHRQSLQRRIRELDGELNIKASAQGSA